MMTHDTSTSLIPFTYRNTSVRTVSRADGATWWVATDVCTALGLSNPSKACERLKVSEKDTLTLSYSDGRPHDILLVNEPGLYRLIMRSRKQEAEAFQDWVFHEVLPQIRRTGAYGQTAPPVPTVQNRTIQMIIDMAVHLDRTEQLALMAQRTADDATRRAEVAEAKADMALQDARVMTLRDFVLKNGLVRQIPESEWGRCAQWLRHWCEDWNKSFAKVPVLGQRWSDENGYPLEALHALLRYEQQRPRQMGLIHPLERDAL